MSLLRPTDPRLFEIGSRKWYTVPLSIVIHGAGVAALVVVPVLATNVLLPSPERLLTFIAAAPVSAVLPPMPRPPVSIPRPHDIHLEAAPSVTSTTPVSELPLPVVASSTAHPGLLTSTASADSTRVVPPPPTVTSAPVRVPMGGLIQPPRKIRDVQPTYPAIARAARASGVVIIEAVIGTDGRIDGARVVRSASFFDQPALDAVRQWRYTPTLLNGQAVEVVLTVAVSFATD